MNLDDKLDPLGIFVDLEIDIKVNVDRRKYSGIVQAFTKPLEIRDVKFSPGFNRVPYNPHNSTEPLQRFISSRHATVNR